MKLPLVTAVGAAVVIGALSMAKGGGLLEAFVVMLVCAVAAFGAALIAEAVFSIGSFSQRMSFGAQLQYVQPRPAVRRR